MPDKKPKLIKSILSIESPSRAENLPYKLTKRACVSHSVMDAVDRFKLGDFSGLARLFREKNSVDIFEFMQTHGDLIACMLTGEENISGCEFVLKKLNGGAVTSTAIGENQSEIIRRQKFLKYGRRLRDSGMELKGNTEAALSAAVKPERDMKQRALKDAGLSDLVVSALLESDRKTKAKMLRAAGITYDVRMALMETNKKARAKLLIEAGLDRSVSEACNLNIPSRETLYGYWRQYLDHEASLNPMLSDTGEIMGYWGKPKPIM